MKRFVLLFTILISTLMPATALAVDVISPACNDINDSTVCKDSASSTNKNTILGRDGIITKVINVLSIVIGIVSVIVIIVAGIRYIVSSGDSGKITDARNSIIYAVVGLVVALLAQAIVTFVIKKLPN